MQTETEIIPVEATHAQGTMTLFRTEDPLQIVERATTVATALSAVIDKAKLYTPIKGKKFVRVEGWTLLGSMLGVFPVVVWTKRVENPERPGEYVGWEARVEARTKDGSVVGAAEASCTRGEKTWEGRDDYALRSMAQTRATSKALRGPLGFVTAMAGYEATPAEEIPQDGEGDFRQEAHQAFGRPAQAHVEAAAEPAQSSPATKGISAPQFKRLQAIAIKTGISADELFAEMQKRGYAKGSDIPKGKTYKDLCTWANAGIDPDSEKGA